MESRQYDQDEMNSFLERTDKYVNNVRREALKAAKRSSISETKAITLIPGLLATLGSVTHGIYLFMNESTMTIPKMIATGAGFLAGLGLACWGFQKRGASEVERRTSVILSDLCNEGCGITKKMLRDYEEVLREDEKTPLPYSDYSWQVNVGSSLRKAS